MKKVLSIVLVVFALTLALASCGGQDKVTTTTTTAATTTTTTTTVPQENPIDPPVHKHIIVVDEAVDATCTSTGLTEGSHCSDCDDVIIAQQEIPIVPHTYDDKYDDTCNKCGHVRDAECAHTEIELIKGKDATCTEVGYTDGEKCKKCGEIITEQEVISTVEHTESNWIVDQKATTAEDGKRHTECLICGMIIAEDVIPMLTGEYKFGMGFFLSDRWRLPIFNTTVVIVVLDSNDKIVCCSIDEVQIKVQLDENGTYKITNLKTKKELGYDYNIAKYGTDTNNDGVVKEWFEQAQAFEEWVIGKTVEEVETMSIQTAQNGYVISADDELLDAGCTIGITDIRDAVVNACNDADAMIFMAGDELELNLSISSYDNGSFDATMTNNGNVCIRTDIRASVVGSGSAVAAIGAYMLPIMEFDYEGNPVSLTNTDAHRASEGLEYTLNSDGESYSITGIGTCTDTYIIIPSQYNGLPITSIGDNAFALCSSITNVIIPNSVESINYQAFCGCTSLVSIEIPNSVINIGIHAFNNCFSLKSIDIPCSVKFIGHDAFTACTSLTSITIPDSVTNIEDYTFYYCTSLENIIIPISVISIGEYAFFRCESLIIYCEATSLPSEWGEYWNYCFENVNGTDYCTVIWGYKPETNQ